MCSGTRPPSLPLPLPLSPQPSVVPTPTSNNTHPGSHTVPTRSGSAAQLLPTTVDFYSRGSRSRGRTSPSVRRKHRDADRRVPVLPARSSVHCFTPPSPKLNPAAVQGHCSPLSQALPAAAVLPRSGEQAENSVVVVVRVGGAVEKKKSSLPFCCFCCCSRCKG